MVRRVLGKMVIYFLILSLLVPMTSGSASASGGESIISYTVPNPGATISSIAKRSDGTMWFTERNTRKLSMITNQGVVTQFTTPNNGRPKEIIEGPDGKIWFTDESTGALWRTSNGVDMEQVIPPLSYDVRELVIGPDNAVWFVGRTSGWILGRVDASGNVTSFALPGDESRYYLAAGPDGALWFTQYSNDTDRAIARMTTSGQYSAYLINTSAGYPGDIDAGPDGALWFLLNNGNVGRIATSGIITEYDTSLGASAGARITSGPDNALWYTSSANTIGRIATDGEVHSYTTPHPGVGHIGIVSDGTDSVWFTTGTNFAGTNPDSYYIGRIQLTLRPDAPENLTAVSPAHTPTLEWNQVESAASYEVFRDGGSVGTSATTSYADSDVSEGSHEYYVKAITSGGETSDSSNTITVVVDKTDPNISHAISPEANVHGWHKSNPMIAFTCSDGLSGIQSCPSPVTVSAEGANQSVVGTAVDNADNSTSATAYVNLDKTPPTASKPKMSNRLIIFSGSVKISAVTSDSLSGVERGEYFIDEDPGQGNGTRMTYNKGKLNARTSISGLGLGRHTVYMRSLDVAGNWSATTSVTFTYVGFPSFWKALILQFLYR